MCGGFPDNQKDLQSSAAISDSGFNQSDNLLNDRYRIIKPLGQGGFGRTFLAIDDKSPQNSPANLCVIKQFLPQSQTEYNHQKAFELFQQESLRLAELGILKFLNY
jgi:serine/threonine protein kinase